MLIKQERAAECTHTNCKSKARKAGAELQPHAVEIEFEGDLDVPSKDPAIWTEKKENPYRKLLLISVRTKTEPVTYIKIVASKAQTENKERMKSTPKESKDSQRRRSDCAAKDLRTIRQTCREVHEDGRTRGREMKPLTFFSRTERNKNTDARMPFGTWESWAKVIHWQVTGH